MHIELLWVIPIISFAIFLFIVAYQVQKTAERRSKTSILSKEVALFNAGQEIPKVVQAEHNDDRLKELEKAINMVVDVLGRQQKAAPEPGMTSDAVPNAETSNEVNELKEKLRTVFKEYDILLSENYTLRAKVKQLAKQIKGSKTEPESLDDSSDSIPAEATDTSKSSMHLYDDTRLINLAKEEAVERSKLLDHSQSETNGLSAKAEPGNT
jgi:hypothetical protein